MSKTRYLKTMHWYTLVTNNIFEELKKNHYYTNFCVVYTCNCTPSIRLPKAFQEKFVCLGFYIVSTVFQLPNSDSSQIMFPAFLFNQYLTSPLS